MCPCSADTLSPNRPDVLLTGFRSLERSGFMTLMAQMDCCMMLGIAPKTLRNWLRHATMQFSTHPTDARLKCLTWEQVQQLATLHARPLQMSPPASPALRDEVPPLDASPGQTAATQANEVSPVSATSSVSEEAVLRKAV